MATREVLDKLVDSEYQLLPGMYTTWGARWLAGWLARSVGRSVDCYRDFSNALSRLSLCSPRPSSPTPGGRFPRCVAATRDRLLRHPRPVLGVASAERVRRASLLRAAAALVQARQAPFPVPSRRVRLSRPSRDAVCVLLRHSGRQHEGGLGVRHDPKLHGRGHRQRDRGGEERVHFHHE